MISLWNGSIQTLQSNNSNNWQYIASLAQTLQATKNPFAKVKATVLFDMSTYPLINRCYRNTFISNANMAAHWLQIACKKLKRRQLTHDDTFMFTAPYIPQQLSLNAMLINSFWQAVSNDCQFIDNVITQNNL